MEEKNNEIKSYIEYKIKELEGMSMYVPQEGANKLIKAFSNRNEEINIIKTRIDTIFANSVSEYKKTLDDEKFSSDELIKVYEKIEKLNKTKVKLYLSGGIVPYVLLNEKSERKHTDLNLLCQKEDMRMIREVFRNHDLYDPKRDSLTYTVNNIDYGFEIIIDKVKVNISSFEEKNDGIIEYYFNSKNKKGKIKNINAKLNDYIVPYVSSDNKKYLTKSLELIISDKLLLNREKDKKDIKKIQECNGISIEKIKKLPLPLVKEENLVGDNLEYTSTMPRIKLEIPKKERKNGFINFGTILLLIAIVVCLILTLKK